jgi:hypothetical protein
MDDFGAALALENARSDRVQRFNVHESPPPRSQSSAQPTREINIDLLPNRQNRAPTPEYPLPRKDRCHTKPTAAKARLLADRLRAANVRLLADRLRLINDQRLISLAQAQEVCGRLGD